MAGTDLSESAKKNDLANVKSNVDDLYIEKLKIILVDLNRLSNVVKTILLKRLYLINWLKKVMLFRLLMLAI